MAKVYYTSNPIRREFNQYIPLINRVDINDNIGLIEKTFSMQFKNDFYEFTNYIGYNQVDRQVQVIEVIEEFYKTIDAARSKLDYITIWNDIIELNESDHMVNGKSYAKEICHAYAISNFVSNKNKYQVSYKIEEKDNKVYGIFSICTVAYNTFENLDITKDSLFFKRSILNNAIIRYTGKDPKAYFDMPNRFDEIKYFQFTMPEGVKRIISTYPGYF